MLSAVPSAPAPPELPASAPPRLRFGRIELRPAERQLRIDGHGVALGARAFDVLLALSERAGRLVTKHELLDLVWPDTVVEENNLPAQVSQLRKVLGRDVIATIPGRGYRFVVLPSSDAAPEAGAAASPRVVDAVPAPLRLRTNLAEGLPTLIGRDDDLARLGALIDAHRLVTLVGAGGMGKTRLAQALLHGRRADNERYPHGVCWIELGAASDAAALPHVIAAALGVRPGAGEPLAGLVAALAPLGVLIALDNAEHLLADVADLARALYEGAARVRIVVTSQAPLKLRAEHIYRLGPLAVPPGPLPADAALGFGAVALFAERAQAADARFALTDANAADAIRVCQALDGLALAIELAAARAPLLGVRGLATSLHERLRLLTSSADRHAPARQQTLRAALEWSHGFLGEPEQRVFRRMAVIAGSASLELLQRVVADDGPDGLDGWAALDALEVLVDRSLVALVASDDAVAPRYRLLDSPRALARERLGAAHETEAVRRHHALAVAARFDAAWAERYSGAIGWDDWARALEPDLDNARDAFAWAKEVGDAATALAIMPSLVWALRQSLHDEQGVHIDACAALADDCEALADHEVAPALRVRAWIAMNLVWVKSHPPRAHAAALRAVRLARECGDRFGLYFALGRTVVAHARCRDSSAGEAALAEMLAIEDPGWPPQRRVLRAAAESYCDWRASGEVTGALDRIRHSLSLYRAAGDGLGSVAGQIYVELGAGGGAESHGTRDAQSLARAQLNLGAAWLAIGDAPQARAALRAGWPEAARFDLQACYADHLALLAALEARPRAAALLAGYAQATYERLGDARQRNEAQALERARRLVHAALGEAEFESLQADGRLLRDAEIAPLAFGTRDA
jgi:predicted ATPase/DNA-binding winged helix-turn-helix (wHTH) protein